MGAPDWETISEQAHAAFEDWQATRHGDLGPYMAAYHRWQALDVAAQAARDRAYAHHMSRSRFWWNVAIGCLSVSAVLSLLTAMGVLR